MSFNLRQARSYAGLSQQEIAKRLGIATVTYQNYEAGDHEMKVNTGKKFSKIVGIPMDQINF